jgi:hypothetical protein
MRTSAHVHLSTAGLALNAQLAIAAAKRAGFAIHMRTKGYFADVALTVLFVVAVDVADRSITFAGNFGV